MPFEAGDLEKIVPEVVRSHRPSKAITLACATLNDGQSLCGVNDIFIGQRTHASARYEIQLGDRREVQSSSGIIVSTGLGATGWLKSILAGADGIAQYCGLDGKASLRERTAGFAWDSAYLYFTVREPYPSTSTGASIVFGKIDKKQPMQIVSFMPENGVIFSDGVEQDFLQFNSGMVASVGLADRQGILVV